MAKPEKKFRARQITATIWKNEIQVQDQTRIMWTTNIEKSYKDKDDNWKTTNRFNADDLPRVALVAQKAYEYITLKEEDQPGKPEVAMQTEAEEEHVPEDFEWDDIPF